MASQRRQQCPRSCSLDSCAPKTRMVVNGENLMKAAAYPPAIVIAVLFRYCCAYTKQISRLNRSDCIKTHRRCRALCSYRSRTRTQRQKIGSKRKFHEHARGAGEPVWNLKWNTHHEQKALRDEKRLAKKIDTGITQMN